MYACIGIIANMRTLLYRTLILLTIFGLIFTPPVVTGYIELERADSVMDNGKFSDAATRYERVTRLLPWRGDLWQRAGMAQFFAAEYTEAIPLFERARQEDSLSAQGWDWLGQSYWQMDDYESAQGAWTAGLAAYPTYIKYYAHLSMAYYEQGDMVAERQALEQWVASGGEITAAAHYRLGQLLTVSDSDKALSQFLIASSLDPEYDTAVETMRVTLNLASFESDQSRRLVVIGRGLGLVAEWPLAADAFRQAVAADGENAEAWAWLGEAEQQLGRDGRVQLDKALSLEHTNPIVRSLRGLYWTRQNRPQQALAEYLLTAEYDQGNPTWQYAIGEIYTQLGDLPPALEHYQRATEIAPADATAWRLLATFCAQYNFQLEETGLPAAQMAVELDDQSPLTLDTLGWTLALLERYNEARDALEQSISLDPNFAQGYLHLAIVAMQLDNWATAHGYLKQARELDEFGPAGEQAQILLNQYFP